MIVFLKEKSCPHKETFNVYIKTDRTKQISPLWLKSNMYLILIREDFVLTSIWYVINMYAMFVTLLSRGCTIFTIRLHFGWQSYWFYGFTTLHCMSFWISMYIYLKAELWKEAAEMTTINELMTEHKYVWTCFVS